MYTYNFMNDQLRLDLLITAIEGGSNYWYYIPSADTEKINRYGNDGVSFAERMMAAIQAKETIQIHDYEDVDECIGSINLESIEHGESLMMKENNSHYLNAIEDCWDAETADVWFQYCVLGEITFG